MRFLRSGRRIDPESQAEADTERSGESGQVDDEPGAVAVDAAEPVEAPEPADARGAPGVDAVESSEAREPALAREPAQGHEPVDTAAAAVADVADESGSAGRTVAAPTSDIAPVEPEAWPVEPDADDRRPVETETAVVSGGDDAVASDTALWGPEAGGRSTAPTEPGADGSTAPTEPGADGSTAPTESDLAADADAAPRGSEADADWASWDASLAQERGTPDGDEVVVSSPGDSLEPRPSRPHVVFWPDPAAEPEDDPAAGGRPSALRFAGLHLRTGQHSLARAELEALAGRGGLDEPGLLDLAEIRWRTGDLAGAGDAASAALARGSESPLALVIAAEAVAAAGRPGEARRLSTRALEAVEGPLDALFAGMPRSTIWPATPNEPDAHADEARRRRGRNRASDTSGAPSTASEAFAGGRAALARGDATRAALLLGVAMRLAPEFAEDVLHAVTGRDDQPLLALVRGDALRLLGREAEALEAFDRARGRASASIGGSQPPSGPGLFDADPALADDDEA